MPLVVFTKRQTAKYKKGVSVGPPEAPPDDTSVPEPAAAEGDSGHAHPSLMHLMYPPLPAKVVWMLQHEPRCHAGHSMVAAAADRLVQAARAATR